MSIIRNIFGGSSDNNGKRKAHAEVKNCNICTEAFQKGKDDFRLPSCVACVESGYVKDAAHWRQVFASQKANTLSPDMAALYEKLKGAKAFLEGNEATSRIPQTSSMRSTDQIKAEQLKYAATLETIKSQVMEHLPAIVAELGLTKVVEEKFGGLEFVADLIVPAKISTPIQSGLATRAALRTIVSEELGHFGVTDSMFAAEASVQSRSHKSAKKSAVKAKIEAALSEGIQRISATSNLSRSLTANSGVFAPEAQGLEQAPEGMMPAPQPGQEPAAVGEEAPPADPNMADASTMGAAPPAEVVGDVVRLPDEEGMADNALATEQAGGMPTMNEGIIPNSEEAFYNGAPDLGGAAAVPPGMEGGVNRVQQAAAPRIRPLKPNKTATTKPNLGMFSFAGRLQQGLPVQSIKLDQKARLTLDNAPALNYITASYTDGSSKTWNIYLADKGAIFASKDSEFLAETPAKFAEFIASDAGFSKWAFLPEELMIEEEVPATDPSALALPGEGPIVPDPISGEGDPSVNEIQPTVLNPSPDNSMQGGIMNQQDTLLHNEDAKVGDGGFGSEDLLAETAVDMLPEIEQQHPGASEEEHMNMALAAAVDFLNRIVATAAGEVPTMPVSQRPKHQKQEGETHADFIGRINRDFPGALRNYRQYDANHGHGEKTLSLEEFLNSEYNNAAAAPASPGAPAANIEDEDAGPRSKENQLLSMERDNKVLQDNPAVPGSAVTQMRHPETGQVLDVPAPKLRRDNVQEQLSNYEFPSIAPLDIDTQLRTQPTAPPAPDTYNGTLPPLADKEVRQDKSLDTPPGAKKYMPPNSYPVAEPLRGAASLIDEILEICAGMTEAEYIQIGLPALVEAGYKDDDIMAVYATLLKEADGDFTVFSDYGTVTDVVHYEEPTEDAKRCLHNAHPDGAQEQSLDMMDAKTAAHLGDTADEYFANNPRKMENVCQNGNCGKAEDACGCEEPNFKKASAQAPKPPAVPKADGPCAFDCDEDMHCNHPRA